MNDAEQSAPTGNGNGKAPPALITFVTITNQRYQFWTTDHKIVDATSSLSMAPISNISIVLAALHSLLKQGEDENSEPDVIGHVSKYINIFGAFITAIEIIDVFQELPKTIPQLLSIQFCKLMPASEVQEAGAEEGTDAKV